MVFIKIHVNKNMFSASKCHTSVTMKHNSMKQEWKLHIHLEFTLCKFHICISYNGVDTEMIFCIKPNIFLFFSATETNYSTLSIIWFSALQFNHKTSRISLVLITASYNDLSADNYNSFNNTYQWCFTTIWCRL